MSMKDKIKEFIIETKEKKDKKKSVTATIEKKVVKEAIKKVVYIQIKAWLLSIFAALLPYLLAIFGILILSFITIISFYYVVNFQHYQNVQELNNLSGTPKSTSQNLWEYLQGGRETFTSTDAKEFNSTSPIPHGWPASGTFMQGYCSNFFISGKGIVYKPHKGNFNGKTYNEGICEDIMKKTKEFKDFAINYSGGDWSKIGSHGGIDIANKTGTDIFSMAKGKIVGVGSLDASWGNYVDVSSTGPDGTQYTVRYAHMSKTMGNPDDEVLAGQKIGEIGSTGLSTGPHLHYSICEGPSTNFNMCYSSNDKYKLVDPIFFSYNFVINGKEVPETDENYFAFSSQNLIGTKVKSGVGSPGDDVSGETYNYANSNSKYVFDGNTILDDSSKEYVYMKVGLAENVSPLALRTLHYRERGGGLTNPEPSNAPGWSGKNEGVYGFFNDFSKLSPMCERSIDNFGAFGVQLTYKNFENQTICAAKVLKYKAGKNLEKYISVDGFLLDENNWENICDILSGWNAGPFYCYNKLYPKYSNNSSYNEMPVFVTDKKTGIRYLKGYNKQLGFLRYALDNYQLFNKLFENYKKGITSN